MEKIVLYRMLQYIVDTADKIENSEPYWENLKDKKMNVIYLQAWFDTQLISTPND